MTGTQSNPHKSSMDWRGGMWQGEVEWGGCKIGLGVISCEEPVDNVDTNRIFQIIEDSFADGNKGTSLLLLLHHSLTVNHFAV
jgi:hypothetical protein